MPINKIKGWYQFLIQQKKKEVGNIPPNEHKFLQKLTPPKYKTTKYTVIEKKDR